MTDQTETRQFVLRDWEFTFKPTMSAKDFGALASAQESARDLFEVYSSVIRNTLVADERKRWDELWEQDMDVPVSFPELDAFVSKLVEAESSRPTQPPSPSGSTAKSTTQNSTAGSDLQEVLGSTPSRSRVV